MSRSAGAVDEVRLDKWLWAVRAFKTRSLSAEACDSGRVTINGIPGKPARTVRVGDSITLRSNGGHRTLRVINLLENRVGAARVGEFVEIVEVVTPPSANDEWKTGGKRGGRPEGRDRRAVRQLFEEM